MGDFSLDKINKHFLLCLVIIGFTLLYTQVPTNVPLNYIPNNFTLILTDYSASSAEISNILKSKLVFHDGVLSGGQKIYSFSNHYAEGGPVIRECTMVYNKEEKTWTSLRLDGMVEHRCEEVLSMLPSPENALEVRNIVEKQNSINMATGNCIRGEICLNYKILVN